MLLSTRGKYYKFQLQNSKPKTLFSMRVRNSKSKTLLSTRGKYYKFQLRNSKPKTLFSTRGNYCKISVTKFKTIDVILMCLEIVLYKHKAVIKVTGIAKQTMNRK